MFGAQYYHGILRKYVMAFGNLFNDIVVQSADLKDGLLIVNLERVIPDEKKPRLIPIG